MGRFLVVVCAVGAVGAVGACGDNELGDELQGGDTTVFDRTQGAYLHPAANLTTDEQQEFQTGGGPFDFHWEIPLLGPLYNNDACFGCHGSNGRGLSQIGPDGAAIDINGPQSEALVRVSFATGTPSVPGGDVPVPPIGLQLHDHATNGLPDGYVTLSWMDATATYGDGTVQALRSPHLDIRTGNSEPLPDGTLVSYRTAPTLIGLGLLDAVDVATVEALADPDDADGDGISGRLNHVWDPIQNMTVPGRFGWKENVPTLQLQAAGAFFNDMGLSNSVFPNDDGTLDVQVDQLATVTFMVSTIAVPAAGPRSTTALVGREKFHDFGCASCHVPTLETGDSAIPELAHQTIHPYTDLLLHDMGTDLADNRPDFEATGTEWRTTPLWGIGLAQLVTDGVTFLHDGRALTLAEAILWHGGEAMAAREAFRNASAADRAALLAFLATL